MGGKTAEGTRKRVVKLKRKNGDVYVQERTVRYNPEKKYEEIVASRIIGKIRAGETEMVPTGSKRPSGSKPKGRPDVSGGVTASRRRVGAMEILDHVGRESGIDSALYESTDAGTAQKIISIARYLVATNGQTLPGIQTWQLRHELPYKEGLSEDVYGGLFRDVGMNETLQQNFFKRRCELVNETDGIAYDSTTISTYSQQLPDARYGFNKAGDGLKTIKLPVMTSLTERQPLAFTKQPGNLSDITSLEHALDELQALGVKAREVVVDNGYCSERNLADLLSRRFGFITLIRTSTAWVRRELDSHMGDLCSAASICPGDTAMHAVMVPVVREFTKRRKYASRAKGLEKGDEESFRRRVYLHLCFNHARQAADKEALDTELVRLRSFLAEGGAWEDLNERSQQLAGTYLVIGKARGGGVAVTFNEDAYREAMKYHGYFAPVSNRQKDPFVCLERYRERAGVETFFRIDKEQLDGSRSRVWDDAALRGRFFVQFVAMCYYAYYNARIRALKASLGRPDPGHNASRATLEEERRLLAWLNNTPLYLQLQWFDTTESVSVSTPVHQRRWKTEITSRDRLYLEKLGVPLD